MGCTQSKATINDKQLEGLEVLFFDCDDTLYQNDWATAERLKKSIERYTVEELGLSENAAFELYLEHGTALRGLMKLNHLPEDKVEHFLQDVHDVSLEEIGPRPELREMLLKLGHKRRWVFTASITEHAERCLEKLGISDLFEGIIDARAVGLNTKHDPMSFVQAMEKANVVDPKKCMLFDDSQKNMATAKRMGFKTCLVGPDRKTGHKQVCEDADFIIDNLMDLPQVMPALFKGGEDITVEDQVSVKGALSPIVVEEEQVQAKEEVEEGEEEEEEEEEEGGEGEVYVAKVPERRVIAVLGGPGSGKGANCTKLVQDFDVLQHLSAGDLLREEMKNPDSENGQLIASCIKEGKLVPAKVTMDLLIKAMNESDKNTFLIDGCPRDEGNLQAFNKYIIDAKEASLVGVLFFDCEEEDMLNRILARAKAAGDDQKRSDDNIETAKKRFATFRNQTMPIVEKYKEQDMLYSIDATRSLDKVYHDTHATVTIMLKGTEPDPLATQPAEKRKSIFERLSLSSK